MRRAISHWPILIVLALYGTSAFVVPTLTDIATTDDWGYTRSVQILYDERRLTIFPVVAATAVFQVAWGTLFAVVLGGATFGVVRISTVAITALGALALYALCRQLGVGRSWSAFGATAYLFNPLTFVLSFTFMTDPHFTALLIIATFFYARGLDPRMSGRTAVGFVIAGSAVAGCAFLTRQQGILIPVAVGTYLLLARRLTLDRAGVMLLLRATALPVVAVIGYYLWLRFVNDVPTVQESFVREARAAGWSGTWDLVRRLAFIGAMYGGFFALPIAAAALPAGRRLLRSIPPAGWVLFCLWEAMLVVGLVVYGMKGWRMPYIPQFVGPGGLGAPDVLGSRPRLLERTFLDWATAVCAASALVVGLIVWRGVGLAFGKGAHGANIAAGGQDAMNHAPTDGQRSHQGRTIRRPLRRRVLSIVPIHRLAIEPSPVVVATIALWQLAGWLPPSFHYRTWTAGSLDRYLLPLLPFVLCLTLWAARDLRLSRATAWLVVAAIGLVSVAGTRDYLVFMDAVWDTARAANRAGVENTRLDAGSGWDGYRLYEYSLANRIPARTQNGPWWVYFYAPATDSSYIVAGRPMPGYVEIQKHPYSSWLESEPTNVYLLRRQDVPGPP